jgi:hypothetical protein
MGENLEKTETHQSGFEHFAFFVSLWCIFKKGYGSEYCYPCSIFENSKSCDMQSISAKIGLTSGLFELARLSGIWTFSIECQILLVVFFPLTPNPLFRIFALPKSEFLYSDLKYHTTVFLSGAGGRPAAASDLQPNGRETKCYSEPHPGCSRHCWLQPWWP